MSDRKYRQRGYMDDSGDRAPREKPAPKPAEPRAPGRQLQSEKGPKTPNLMSSHEVFRCSRCGNLLALTVEAGGTCGKCGAALHSCIQCTSFDTSARFECSQTALTARVSPKDETNTCTYFAARTTVERQTSTPAQQSPATNSAKKAFDDLFNF
ncbi:MAG TPA: hypothetical protein VN628_10740 [Vicinamibacterales bacterium]|nr:hypothetical protein [Vicinamibacterales bacterium]